MWTPLRCWLLNLHSDAQKTQEYLDGIAKLWQHNSEHNALNEYIELIKSFNSNGNLDFYPSSPKIAEHFLRRQDNGWFFELHPRDLELLQDNMKGVLFAYVVKTAFKA